MWTAIAGGLGFCLYFLYDINSFRWHTRILSFGFGVGSILLAAATCAAVITAILAKQICGVLDWILFVLAIISFAALIYTLFFALPFSDTYTKQENGRAVCDRGAYALCRHPAAIPFFFLYLFLGLSILPGRFLLTGIGFSVLNFLYIWFQDRVTFPKCFCDYQAYRMRVPFLIPTRASIHQAIVTSKKPAGKKVLS